MDLWLSSEECKNPLKKHAIREWMSEKEITVFPLRNQQNSHRFEFRIHQSLRMILMLYFGRHKFSLRPLPEGAVMMCRITIHDSQNVKIKLTFLKI